MSNGSKKSLFKDRNSVRIYLEQSEKERITKFAEKSDISVGQFAREAFELRMSETDNLFDSGFNAGIQEAMRIVRQTDGAKMMFPSGKSFADLVSENLTLAIRDGQ
jgi:hypothetical protein